MLPAHVVSIWQNVGSSSKNFGQSTKFWFEIHSRPSDKTHRSELFQDVFGIGLETESVHRLGDHTGHRLRWADLFEIWTALSPFGHVHDQPFRTRIAISTSKHVENHWLVFKLVILSENNEFQAKLNLFKNDGKENVVGFHLKRKSSPDSRTSSFAIKTYNFAQYQVIQAQFTLTYGQNDVVGSTAEEDTALFTGRVFYNNHRRPDATLTGSVSLNNISQSLNPVIKKCKQRNQVSACFEVFENKYNRLSMEIHSKKHVPEAIQQLYHQLYVLVSAKYQEGVEDAEPDKTLSRPTHYQILFDSFFVDGDLFYNLLVSGKQRSMRIRDLQLPFRFPWPSKSFHSEYFLAHLWPSLRAPICSQEGDLLNTFDGTKRRYGGPNCMTLYAADCVGGTFLLLHRPGESRIIFNGGNLSITEESLLVKSVYLDGERTPLELGQTKKFRGALFGLRRFDYHLVLQVVLPQDVSLVLRGRDLSVKAGYRYRGRLCGICGDSDGDWSNDQDSPKGRPLINSEDKRLNWVLDRETCPK